MRQLAATIEFSDDAIFSVDASGNILTWNQGAARLFGYSYMEVVGKNVAIIIPVENRESELQFTDKRELLRFDTTRIRKDGTRVDISCTMSPILDWQQQVVIVVVSVSFYFVLFFYYLT